ncbi:MAG: hypothetical protein ACK5JM_02520 [Rhodoblastus sp.]
MGVGLPGASGAFAPCVFPETEELRAVFVTLADLNLSYSIERPPRG